MDWSTRSCHVSLEYHRIIVSHCFLGSPITAEFFCFTLLPSICLSLAHPIVQLVLHNGYNNSDSYLALWYVMKFKTWSLDPLILFGIKVVISLSSTPPIGPVGATQKFMTIIATSTGFWWCVCISNDQDQIQNTHCTRVCVWYPISRSILRCRHIVCRVLWKKPHNYMW